jgi:hypothetical protein
MQRWNETERHAEATRGSVSPLEWQLEHAMAVITDQPDLSLEETGAATISYSHQPQRTLAFFSPARLHL